MSGFVQGAPSRGRRRIAARALRAALSLCLLAVASVARAQAADGTAPPGFIQDGQLVLCTNPTLPPMTFVNGTDPSDVTGYDIDLMRALAARWHVPLVIDTMDFQGMFPSLSAGRCGVVASGVLAQAARERNFDAVPYLNSSLAVVAKAGTPAISRMTDLSGQVVAAQSGTSYAGRIEAENATLRTAGRPPIVVQQYPTEDQVVQQVLIGRVQAFVSQDVELYYRQKQLGGKVAIIFRPDYPDYREFAVYIRKNDQDKAALADAVAALHQSGELDRLARKWGVSGEKQAAFAARANTSRFDTGTFLHALASPAFLKGAALTLVLALASHLTAIAISIPMALALNARRRSPLQPILAAYVGVFRAAPTLLQLLFIWNALPQFFPIFREGWFTPFLAAWISLSINESAYQVEINRAALRAVEPGQALAAGALGMKPSLVFRHVTLPQALRIALPPTVNDFITLLKTTSLASVISLQELLSVTQIQVARSFQFTEYYAAALVYYLVMVFFFLGIQRAFERRFAWADHEKAVAHGA